MRNDAHWRPTVLQWLRTADPGQQIAGMERIQAGYVRVDDEIETLLLDALDDPGVHTFQTRDWDDADDEFGRKLVTRSQSVAAEAVKILGGRTLRERSVAAIEARMSARGEEASESLYRALAELGPQSIDRLLRDVEHPSERVRSWARAALSRAIHWSTPAQRFAILDRAIARLPLLAESDDWGRLLDAAYGAFSPYRSPPLREHVVGAGPDHQTVLAWLGSDVRAIRRIAISVLAHRARDPRVRAILGEWIATALPLQRGADTERDAFRHRQPTVAELAIEILAVAEPEALASIRAENAAAGAAMREYVLFELSRPDGEGLDGAPWFVAAAVAKCLSDDPAVREALRERTDRTRAAARGKVRT